MLYESYTDLLNEAMSLDSDIEKVSQTAIQKLISYYKNNPDRNEDKKYTWTECREFVGDAVVWIILRVHDKYDPTMSYGVCTSYRNNPLKYKIVLNAFRESNGFLNDWEELQKNKPRKQDGKIVIPRLDTIHALNDLRHNREVTGYIYFLRSVLKHELMHVKQKYIFNKNKEYGGVDDRMYTDYTGGIGSYNKYVRSPYEIHARMYNALSDLVDVFKRYRGRITKKYPRDKWFDACMLWTRNAHKDGSIPPHTMEKLKKYFYREIVKIEPRQ